MKDIRKVSRISKNNSKMIITETLTTHKITNTHNRRAKAKGRIQVVSIIIR